jgi:beta-1,4-mannosyltransferase
MADPSVEPSAGGRQPTLKVLAFPRDWNPYQELLYGPMRADPDLGITIAYSARLPYVWPFAVPMTLVGRRLQGYRILHVHWQALQVSSRVPGSRRLSYWSYRAFYRLALTLGYVVVWTVHNVVPHETQTTDDVDVSVRLSRIATAKIVHSQHARDQMVARGLDAGETTVIPHGNYIGVYPDTISRDEMRERLGLAPDDVAVLFFGNMRPYKGVNDLLAAWPLLEGTRARLIAAGECSDEQLQEGLRGTAATFINRRIADQEVAALFQASDVVCAPFRAVTTSGSVLLALSFGRPVVVPRTGAMLDLPSEVGFFYDSGAPDGLVSALLAAVSSKDLASVQDAARAYAAAISWEAVARATAAVYRSAIASPRIGR